MATKAENLIKAMGGNITSSIGGGPELRGGRPAAQVPALDVKRATNVIVIPTEMVDPDPDQPREDFGEADESLDQLSASIAEQGQLQTVVVYEEGGRYMLVCGERRWRAAKKAGLTKINATLLLERPDELMKIILQHQENRQRKALTRNEEAKVFRTLMDKFGMSRADVARKLAISESDVSRALAIDEKLPEDVKEKVAEGKIAPSVAYEITKVQDPDRQRALAELAELGATREAVAAEAKKARADAGQVVAQRKPPTSRSGRGALRQEFPLGDGASKVMLTGPAASNPETCVDGLREALAQAEVVLAEQRGDAEGATRDQAA